MVYRISDLKKRFTFDELLKHLGAPIIGYNPRKGVRARHKCIYCDAAASVSWYPDSMHCFSCSENKDFISILEHCNSLSFREAVEEICGIVGIEISEVDFNFVSRPSIHWKAGMEVAQKYIAEHRVVHPCVQDYFDRKLIDFSLAGVPFAILETEKKPYPAIEIRNKTNNRIGVKRLDKNKCTMPGKEQGSGFFYTHLVKNSPCIVVEGASDYLTMKQWGYENVVGVDGVGVRVDELMELLKDHPGSTVLLDSDLVSKKEGSKPTYSGIKKARQIKDQMGKNINIRFVNTDNAADIATTPLDISDLFMQNYEKIKEPLTHQEKVVATKKYMDEILEKKPLSAIEMNRLMPSNAAPEARVISMLLREQHRLVNLGKAWWECGEENGNIWTEKEEEGILPKIASFIENEIDVVGNRKRVDECIKNLQTLTQHGADCEMISRSLREPKENYGFINFKNGKFDVKTKEMHAYSPEDYVFSHVPHDYVHRGSEARFMAPNFMRFLDDSFATSKNKKEMIDFLLEVMGTTLCAFPVQKFFYVYGPGGNGKGVLFRLLREITGASNSTSVDLMQIAQNKFLRGELLGKYVVFMPETQQNFNADDAYLKMLTGEDPIYAERKFQKGFTFTSFAKIFISSNHLPSLGNCGEQITRRIVLIPMKTRLQDIGRQPDPDLVQKISKEIPYILNILVESFSKFLERGSLLIPKDVEAEISSAISETDTINQFVQDQEAFRYFESIDLSQIPGYSQTTDSAPCSSVYQLYRAYCKEMGFERTTIIKPRDFNDLLIKKIGPENIFVTKNKKQNMFARPVGYRVSS